MKTDVSSHSLTNPVIVTVELSRILLPDEEYILSRLNKQFKPHEISLNFSDQSLIAFLYTLDPGKYEKAIQDYMDKTNLCQLYSDGLENPFEILMSKILSIGSYGIRYRKRVYVGYASERKVAGRKEKENERGAYFYIEGNTFHKEVNELPKQYQNQILCGDSEKILKNLPDNCIDLIITSPPYNFGLDYASSGDSAHWEEYLEKLYRVFSEGIRVLKFGGRFIVNVQPLFSDYIPLHHLISSFFMNQKMIWKGEILWEKNNYNCKYTSWGSWKSPSSPYLKYTWEFIEIFCKGSLKKTGKSENADITDEEFKSWVVAKWSIGPERRMKEYNHPAMFPEELVNRCLKLFSYKDDIILDPFNGAGTTTAVAARTGRRYLGIDISSEYCLKAEERIDAFQNKPKNLENKEKIEKRFEKSFTSEPEPVMPRRRGRPRKVPKEKEMISQPSLDHYYSDST